MSKPAAESVRDLYKVALNELMAAVKEWRIAEIAVDTFFEQEGEWDDNTAEDLEQSFQDAEENLRRFADILIAKGVVTR